MDEIKAIRDSAKDKVSNSLQAISQAAERIAAELLQQMTSLHSMVRYGHLPGDSEEARMKRGEVWMMGPQLTCNCVSKIAARLLQQPGKGL